MGAFGGMILTSKGRALQNKAQAGAVLHYTRIGLGDGSLTGQSITDLTVLISEKKSLAITKLKTLSGTQTIVGGVLSNQDIVIGFYFREIGVFAQDPDLGEILFCYGNAGANAEYIPATGGPDIVEKNIDLVTITGNASSVTATIDQSLIYVSQPDFDGHKTAAVLDHPDGSVTTAKLADVAITDVKLADGAATDAKIGNRTIDDTIAAAAGADSPTGLFSKLANMVKKITGKANWYTDPAITLETVSTYLNQNVKSTASPTFAKVTVTAAPQAGTDLTNKDYVDQQIALNSSYQ